MPTILEVGGRVQVVDDHPEVIEGQWHGPRTVVVEFDTVEVASAWYKSPEYQAVVGQRLAAADCNGAIVSGFELPGG